MKPSFWAVMIVSLVWFAEVVERSKWEGKGIFGSTDTRYYYSYLPIMFIYKDLSFSFHDQLSPELQKQLTYVETMEGKRIPKMWMGTAVFISPFFCVLSDFI